MRLVTYKAQWERMEIRKNRNELGVKRQQYFSEFIILYLLRLFKVTVIFHILPQIDNLNQPGWEREPKIQSNSVYVLSHVQLFGTSWTIAHQDPLSIGLFTQEYWNGLQFSSLGDLPNPGIQPTSPASPVLAGRFFTTELSGKI